VLQWLQDRKLSESSGVNAESLLSIQAEDSVNVESEPQWLRDFRNPNSEKDQKVAGKNIKKRAFNSKVLNISSGKKDQQSDSSYKESENVSSQDRDQETEEAFLLDDYDSDNEYVGKTTRKRKAANASGGSSDEEFDLEEDKEENEQPLKVFFCSRTHSQLSQFVKELQKTVFSSSLRAVTLGSRKSLCINPGMN
jgi:chromosome transmission fidelity protein 1